MNPFVTTNLRADAFGGSRSDHRELRAEIHKQEISIIQGQLETALPLLKSAYETGEKAGLKASNYELLQALGDALTACTDALERIDDVPDEVYDVALNHLSPITGIAHPPLAAF